MKQENVDDSMATDQNKTPTMHSANKINASLKTIYNQLKPPMVSQRVFDDLSICIVFQMLLFLANEHVSFGLIFSADIRLSFTNSLFIFETEFAAKE